MSDCARPECPNDVLQPRTGRPRKYCTSYCRKRHWVDRHTKENRDQPAAAL